MKIEDIKVGERYQLTFKPDVAKTKVADASCNSAEFVLKYLDTLMKEHQDKLVVVLRNPTKHSPPAVRFHFETDPPTCYCTIYPKFFKPLVAKSNSTSACQCNLWISGCKCGAFKAEQAKP